MGVCMSVCRGGSFRPPPALCVSRGEMRDARWSSSLWVSKGDGTDGDIRRERRQSSRMGCSDRAETSVLSLPSGALSTPWLLSTGWSYHFLTMIVMVYKPNQADGDMGSVRRSEWTGKGRQSKYFSYQSPDFYKKFGHVQTGV